MTRPLRLTINSQLAAWDAPLNTDFAQLYNQPIPIYENAAFTSLALLDSTFAASAFDRCLAWINLTTFGWTLCYSNGLAWIPFGDEKRPLRAATGTVTQIISDKFVRFTGAGGFDYDFLTASAWAGMTVEIRNDCAAAINLDPNAAELINGAAASLVLAVGSTARAYSDGTALYASVSL